MVLLLLLLLVVLAVIVLLVIIALIVVTLVVPVVVLLVVIVCHSLNFDVEISCLLIQKELVDMTDEMIDFISYYNLK